MDYEPCSHPPCPLTPPATPDACAKTGKRTRAQHIIDRVRDYRHGQEAFDDDVSLLEVEFAG